MYFRSYEEHLIVINLWDMELKQGLHGISAITLSKVWAWLWYGCCTYTLREIPSLERKSTELTAYLASEAVYNNSRNVSTTQKSSISSLAWVVYKLEKSTFSHDLLTSNILCYTGTVELPYKLKMRLYKQAHLLYSSTQMCMDPSIAGKHSKQPPPLYLCSVCSEYVSR